MTSRFAFDAVTGESLSVLQHDVIRKVSVHIMSDGFSRRHFLGGLGVAAGASAVALGAPEAHAIGLERKQEEPEKPPLQTATVPFDGANQAGIETPAQANLWLVSFDVKKDVGRERMRNLMRVWTDDARRMTSGQASRTDLEPELMVAPANLTITVGFGENFFTIIDKESEKPDWLADLPEYGNDELKPEWSGGDLCLQICADDPVMVSHAARMMTRNSAPYLDVRWVQTGFQHAQGSLQEGETPRNLFGQKDGTINPHTRDEFAKQVWIDSGPDWLRGGSAMVVRRIEMDLPGWDVLDRESRTVITGREIGSGAPVGGKDEFETVDLSKTDEYGLPLTDPHSHVALAMPPKEYPNQKLLRRVYNYDLPPESDGKFDTNTGLVFICYQKNPLEQFHPIQERLAENDRMNQWIFHIGSAVFVMPRGTSEDEYWAQDLLED